MGTDRVVCISINYIWLLAALSPGPGWHLASELYFSFAIPSLVTPHWPQQWSLIITVPVIILPWPRFLLIIINTITIIHGQGVSSVLPLRPGNTSWWEPLTLVTAVPNIDSHQIWTFKRFEMLFDLMIILVSDLTNKNGLTLDTWTDNSSNSLISLTSIHYQF